MAVNLSHVERDRLQGWLNVANAVENGEKMLSNFFFFLW